MAVTEITQSIRDITGIGSVSSHSIEDGQRFVVSSVPKNLLSFAQTASSASTDGSAISFSTNDSIVDVQRNGYSCTEIPLSEAKWALDSTSLQFATAKSPVWYHKQGSVHFAPVTDGSNAGYVFYIDYSKIDDSSDLRNAVIFYAVSHEFAKLASSKIGELTAFESYWTLADFGDSDPGSLSVSATPPVLPPSPSFSTPTITAVTVGSTEVNNLGVPPTYTVPTIPSTAGGGATADDLTVMTDSDWSDLDFDFDDENIDVATWFQTLGDMIQNQEDFELASAQVQKISSYISAYQAAMQNRLNKFNEENAEYQVKLQEAIQQSTLNNQQIQQQATLDSADAQQEANLLLQKEQQEYASELQRFAADMTVYTTDVNKEVQSHTQNLGRYQAELETVFGAWSKLQSDRINNATFYSSEAKKYYEWARLEVSSYVANNSKMISQRIAAQQSAQQGE